MFAKKAFIYLENSKKYIISNSSMQAYTKFGYTKFC